MSRKKDDGSGFFGSGKIGDFGRAAFKARTKLVEEHIEAIMLAYLAASGDDDPIVVLFDPRDPLGRLFGDDGDKGTTVRAYDREDVVRRTSTMMNETVWEGIRTDSRRGCLALLVIASGGAMYTHPAISSDGRIILDPPRRRPP